MLIVFCWFGGVDYDVCVGLILSINCFMIEFCCDVVFHLHFLCPEAISNSFLILTVMLLDFGFCFVN